MMEMRIFKTLSDLPNNEQLHSHCMLCNLTGDALDTNILMKQFGKNAPLQLIKRYCVCKNCSKKDEIILCLKSKALNYG